MVGTKVTSSFVKELMRLSGCTKACAEALEAAYGGQHDFVDGMNSIAMMIARNALPATIPKLMFPWSGILSKINANVSTGLDVQDAWNSAIGMSTIAARVELDQLISGRAADLMNNAAPANTSSGNVSNNRQSADYVAHLAYLGYTFKLNLAGRIIEVNGEPLTDELEAEIRLKMMDAGFVRRNVVGDVIRAEAYRNSYHPVQDYLNGLAWDGKSHIEPLTRYIDFDGKLFPSLLRKWFIGSVDRVMVGGQNPMLVLDGEQDIGKSEFVAWLCPAGMKSFFREGAINPDLRDHRIAAASSWIWEVGELGSTTRRADREALKNFLTTRTFNERQAYARNSTSFQSMASFVGTINNEAGILDDPTGSRRFRVVKINSFDWRNYVQDIDVSQCWAEAVAAWKDGETNELSDIEKMIEREVAQDYQVINITEEAIKRHFHIDPANTLQFTQFADIRRVLKDPLRGDLQGNDISDRKIAAALRTLGLSASRLYLSSISSTIRGYYGIWEK